MDLPLITVIVPVYKVEQYLLRCVNSIINQTYDNLEIILVDDGSPDNCGKICDELALKDSRIQVIHKANGGLSDARNAGLNIMKGEFVGFVDSDDWIEPEMYETLYNNMLAEMAEISCCGIAISRIGKKDIYYNSNKEEFCTLSTLEAHIELLKNIKITNSVCDKLYSAQIFDGMLMKTGVLYEDMQIQPFCIERARRVTYSSKPMYHYYMSEESILRGNISIRQYDCIEHSNQRMEFYRERDLNCFIASQIAHVEILLDYIYLSYGNSDWDQKRLEMMSQLREISNKEICSRLAVKNKIKVYLCLANMRLYVKCMRIYFKLKHKR